jgi:midasin (ATPase involved in ribosome maturation)
LVKDVWWHPEIGAFWWLWRMPMTAGCDTVELLGGFEQIEGTRGAFGWRDSVLVQALEKGEWLVIDNVNFCNPTLLIIGKVLP